MKARREKQKTFSVAVDREKMLRFEKKISEQGKTKSEWLNEKIDEELKNKKYYVIPSRLPSTSTKKFPSVNTIM